MDKPDMGFSTQLLRWWKSKWVGGYKNFQGMVEKHSDTEDLLQSSECGSMLRGRSGLYTDTPLSRLSSHYECEDMGGFTSVDASVSQRQRCHSTGGVERGGVREGILIDLMDHTPLMPCGCHDNQTRCFHGNEKNARGVLSNERKSHSNEENERIFLSNQRESHSNEEKARTFLSNQRESLSNEIISRSVLSNHRDARGLPSNKDSRHSNEENARIFLSNQRQSHGNQRDPRGLPSNGVCLHSEKERRERCLGNGMDDVTYDVSTVSSRSALEKKSRKEFALTLYDLDGRGQLNRHDIEGLVNKMLETLQQSKPSQTKDPLPTQPGRSKTIRINFSISPQSTLSKTSAESTLEKAVQPKRSVQEPTYKVQPSNGQLLPSKNHFQPSKNQSQPSNSLFQSSNSQFSSTKSQSQPSSSHFSKSGISDIYASGKQTFEGTSPLEPTRAICDSANETAQFPQNMYALDAALCPSEDRNGLDNIYTSRNLLCPSEDRSGSNNIYGSRNLYSSSNRYAFENQWISEDYDPSHPNAVNSNSRLADSRLAMSTEHLVPNSPELSRRRTKSIEECLVPASESFKENRSPNVDAVRRGAYSEGGEPSLTSAEMGRRAILPSLSASSLQNSSSFQNISSISHPLPSPESRNLNATVPPISQLSSSISTALQNPSIQRLNPTLPQISQSSAKSAESGSLFSSGVRKTAANFGFGGKRCARSGLQNLLSTKKTCLPSSVGKLSLLNPAKGSQTGGKFSYKKLDDGGYYQSFTGINGVSGMDRLSETKPLEASEPEKARPSPSESPLSNEYVEPACMSSRPPCLLPWEMPGGALAAPGNRGRSPGKRPSETLSPANLSPAARGEAGISPRGGPVPRVLRNRKATRKLRRRHSVCAPVVVSGWPQEDREADVSADEEEDSDFGTSKHFGHLGISPIRNSGDSKWRRRRSSSLLQRQELLQIIRANMEKNKSCFLQPRRKPSFHHHHHSHHSTSHLPFPYNQHLPPTLEHPDTPHHRRYTTNSILSHPRNTHSPEERPCSGNLGNFSRGRHSSPPGASASAAKPRFASRLPRQFTRASDLETALSQQFEQHQAKLNSREQKLSRVGELTVANVNAKNDYVALGRGPPAVEASLEPPVGKKSPYQLTESKKSPYYHRYVKQSAKRRNHSFHFNKNDFVETDAPPLDAIEGNVGAGVKTVKRLGKTRSFHCTSNAGEPNPTLSGAKPTIGGPNPTLSGAKPTLGGHNPTLTGLNPPSSGANPTIPVSPESHDTSLPLPRKHLGRRKPSKSPSKISPDPIYDEINLAESQKLEAELLSQPLYRKMPLKETFNLRLNEANRIVYDDSDGFHGNKNHHVNKNHHSNASFVYKKDFPLETRAGNHGNASDGLDSNENPHGNASFVYKDSPLGCHSNGNFVYKQNRYASPSAQQKILRRSKSGLIEPEEKIANLAVETAKLSIDGRSPVKERLNGVIDSSGKSTNGVLNSVGGKSRHQSPKENSLLYKHYNLDRQTDEKPTSKPEKPTKRDRLTSPTKTERKSEKVAKSTNKPEDSRSSEIKQSRVVRNLKTFFHTSAGGNSRTKNEEIDQWEASRDLIGGEGKVGGANPGRERVSLDRPREGKPARDSKSERREEKRGREEGKRKGGEVGGVINNHIYVNTREHHLCCINVLEHTLCCHSNVRHDAFCCQGNANRQTTESCRKTSETCRKTSDSCRQTSESCRKASESCRENIIVNVLPPNTPPRRHCSHGAGKTAQCSLHYLKHKYRDENEKLAREQVLKWLENDFTCTSTDSESKASDEEDLLESEEEDEEDHVERLEEEELERLGEEEQEEEEGEVESVERIEEEGNLDNLQRLGNDLETDEQLDTDDLGRESNEDQLEMAGRELESRSVESRSSLDDGEQMDGDERGMRREKGVQLHKHVHHHFYHFDSVLV
ncbi:hypothetical protein M8J75_012150 [Diaphorina citri]|nr:hypothetical protein M8J75_012150 [Diaphorina citri]